MRRRAKFEPFVVYDVFAYTRSSGIAAQAVEDGYSVLYRDPTGKVVVLTIAEAQVPSRWGRGVADPISVATDYKSYALRCGATPEAIRLIGQFVTLTKNEEISMADKLKTKAAPKAADKEALVSAAKAAPVAKPKAAPAKVANKGGEALKAANEARQAGVLAERNKQKIKVLNKNHTARDGSNRANMLNIVLRSKSVGEAIENGAGWIDVKFAKDAGYIDF